MVLQIGAHHREGFDQARDIFLRTDGTGVEQKRIADLVALENAVALARGGFRAIGGRGGSAAPLQELRIGRVVNQPDACGGVRDQIEPHRAGWRRRRR